MSEQMVSNILLFVMLFLIFCAVYLNFAMYRIFKKKVTSHEPLLDNRTFADDLKMEEKYVFSDPAKKRRKPITRSDVSLWEQENSAKD